MPRLQLISGPAKPRSLGFLYHPTSWSCVEDRCIVVGSLLWNELSVMPLVVRDSHDEEMFCGLVFFLAF